MNRLNLILGIMGILGIYGCTVEEPYPFTTKCSDETHGLSAVAYNSIICTPADVTGDKKADCAQFADSFKYGSCHLVSPLCIHDDENGTYMCSTSYCKLSQHEENGVCKDNDVNNCGGAKVRCSENMAGWLEGVCESDYSGVSCFATECAYGYKLNEAEGKCEKESGCPEHEHITPEGVCEPDEVENCGFYGNNCQKNITGWKDGQCEEGLCRLSACEDGYALEDGKCQPMIECQATEHIYITEDSKCEMDTVSNCGHHGNDCAWSDGWSDGTCIEGRCVASVCQDGYDLKSGTCRFHVVSCEENQHLFNQACENNSIEHCGQYDYHCGQRIPGWNGGACVQGICEASGCLDGYRFETSSKSCVALMTCDVHKHVLGNACVEDTVEACGSENNNCTRRAGWADGSCVDADCVATECAEGYEVNNGQCVAAKPEKQCTGCKSNEVCVDGKCVVTKCTQNCNTYNHAISGVCSVEGKCVATACAANYHLYNGTCELNTDEHCGSHEVSCSVTKNEICVPEQKKCVCQDEYELYEGECKIKGYNPLCDDDNYMTVTYDGHEIKAWCIKTVDDLLQVKDSYPDNNRNNAFALVNDLDVGNLSMKPDEFKGKLFGNGHKITGKLQSASSVALFEEMTEAYVENLFLYLDVTSSEGNAAGLALELNYSTINNVHLVGHVIGSGSVGGLVVDNEGSKYTDCSAEGTIVSNNGIAAGLVATSADGLTINNCSVNGNVIGVSEVGGLAGSAGWGIYIDDSSFAGSIRSNGAAGGIIGSLGYGDHISHSFVKATIEGKNRVGGIAGSVYIIRLISDYFEGTVKGDNRVGGIVGDGSGSILQCAVFGQVNGTSSSSEYIGGIYGSGIGEVESSFSAADVSNGQSGALIGSAENGVTVSDTYTIGNLSGFSDAGSAWTDINPCGQIDRVKSEGFVGSLYQANSGCACSSVFLHNLEFDSRNLLVYQGNDLKDLMKSGDVWITKECEITTGPAHGSKIKFNLLLPLFLPKIDFCN